MTILHKIKLKLNLEKMCASTQENTPKYFIFKIKKLVLRASSYI